MLHTVIMAGGGGTRLWPLPTPKRPKQYLALTAERSMLGQTLDRVEALTPAERTWIVTMRQQRDAVLREAASLPGSQLLLEPMGRNTAAAIGLSAVRILADDPDAILAVLPADHRIADDKAFVRCLRDAESVVTETDAIVTLGIEPTRPETGYGYIERDEGESLHGSVPVRQFREKPDRDTAESYIETGGFYWNAGIFIARAQRLLDELEMHVPNTHATLEVIGQALKSGDEEEVALQYESLESISIDYAVMERAENVRVIPADFGWSDVGGYEELLRISAEGEMGNAVKGEVLLDEVHGSYVRNETGIPLAVLGVEGLVVVATEDGILVTTVEASQRAKLGSEWTAKSKS